METLQPARRRRRTSLSLLIAGLLIASSPLTVGAAAIPAATTTVTNFQMVFIGYDTNYLEEHGLEAPAGATLIDADQLRAGQTFIRARTTSGKDVIVSPNATVTGACGTSTVLATRYGSNLTIGTRYTIAGDLASEHWWFVNVKTDTHNRNEDFSGLAPLFSKSWDATRVVALMGADRSGRAMVTAGSFAITATGRICYSMSPSQPFS